MLCASHDGTDRHLELTTRPASDLRPEEAEEIRRTFVSGHPAMVEEDAVKVEEICRKKGATDIRVTENGASYSDGPGPDGRIHDRRRIVFLWSHLSAIADAIDLRDPSLIHSKESLYRKGYVSEGVCGNLFSVAKDINSPPKDYSKRELLNIYDRYAKIITTWACFT